MSKQPIQSTAASSESSTLHPAEILKFAEKLLDEDAQAALRAAIHCAYYAVYHQCAAYFTLDPAKYVPHKDVDAQLRLTSSTPANHPNWVRKAKQHFPSLRALRVQADYDLRTFLEADEAERAVELAKAVLLTK